MWPTLVKICIRISPSGPANQWNQKAKKKRIVERMIKCTVRKISFPALPTTNYHLNLQKYIVCWPISTLSMQNWPTWQRCGQNTSVFLCHYTKHDWLVSIIYISVKSSPNYENNILSLLFNYASKKTVLVWPAL